MPDIFEQDQVYKFLKVEEYFSRYREWKQLGNPTSWKFSEDDKTLALQFQTDVGKGLTTLVIALVQNDVFRVRFNPLKHDASEYTPTKLSESNLFDENDEELRRNKIFNVTYEEKEGVIELVTKSKFNSIVMRIAIMLAPFQIKVYNESEKNKRFSDHCVWESSLQGIYYTPHGEEDFAIIQAVQYAPTGKYIGFGEQGGIKLTQNTDQLNYFNFDNMRYRQVYNRGPLDNREPLYHSEPFFYELNKIPGSGHVTAVFLDNPGQVFIDMAFENSTRYLLGTRFFDMDYYVMIADEPKDILDSFTAIVGRAALKPRYALGYHQGCYGYENRNDLEWAVKKHREYGIPLDGMAVDVDVQRNYRTFTIDESRYPDPKGMFKWLRDQGVKCSTNITPVISCQDKDNPDNYSTYKSGLENDFFVLDQRYDADNPKSKVYQLYGGGVEFCPNQYRGQEPEGYNSGKPYIGEVYYGNDQNNKELGSPGHYPDFGRPEVRKWWGNQYQYLYEMGLEFVWQDMTTPAIRDFRGDMKGFPFKLLVSDDFDAKGVKLTPALKVWNQYSYNLHRATFEGLDNLHEVSEALKWRENRRNFIIGRGSYVGSHRYAGLWTGDNSSDWDFLQTNITQVLSLGLHALAISGQDIGGFEESVSDGKKWADPELLIRWTCAGAFLPWFRNHYVRKGRKHFQEVFQYENWFNEWNGGKIPEPQYMYRAVLPVCRYYISLRYRLMQVFYDCLFENTINGMPISRPLFLVASNDYTLYNDKEQFLSNEFFVGNDILVAPVIRPEHDDFNHGKRNIYLPLGSDWYNFVDTTKPLLKAYIGGTTICDFDAHISIEENHLPFVCPIFIRSGAIVPMVRLEQFVGQLNSQKLFNPITLNIYPGESGSYTMYLDDGVSRSSAPDAEVDDPKAANEYRETNIQHVYNRDTKSRRVTVERVHNGYTPMETYFYVRLLHAPEEIVDKTTDIGGGGPVTSVQINGDHCMFTEWLGEQAADESDGNLWFYDAKCHATFVKVYDDKDTIEINMEYI